LTILIQCTHIIIAYTIIVASLILCT